MKPFAIIILIILLFIYIQIEISAMNPCSNFSSKPSGCNSDNIGSSDEF